MVRSTDQEVIAIEKIVCSSQFPGGEAHHVGHMVKHQSWSGSRGDEGKVWARAFTVGR